MVHVGTTLGFHSLNYALRSPPSALDVLSHLLLVVVYLFKTRMYTLIQLARTCCKRVLDVAPKKSITSHVLRLWTGVKYLSYS